MRLILLSLLMLASLVTFAQTGTIRGTIKTSDEYPAESMTIMLKGSVENSDITGDFNLPSYAALNGGISYNSDDVRITVNVNNFTNTAYYIGYWSVNPQKPRNIVASLSFKF